MTDERPQVKVPCNGCTICCRDPAPPPLMMAQDGDFSRYKTVKMGSRIFLARAPNGDCVYLDKNGCSIHEDRPYQCRMFDCRTTVDDPRFEEAIRARGKELLEQQEKED